ncbi:hypothetical protein [Dysgonomonas termitidis]|uniref:Uncharacterized protein n=1 Tax=Dysgonomonas termitidis TaxID=1516126 RepID=A0ABV9L1U2_9BACT
MSVIDDLIAQATLIRDEIRKKANTAYRVGTCLLNIINFSKDYTDGKVNTILILIPSGTNTGNMLINNDQLNNALAGFSQGFFEYKDQENFIVQTEAQLPTQLPSGDPIPDGYTALYMDATKTIVYKTTYTAGAWGAGVDQNAEPGFLWTETITGNGYYFMPGQDWNQLDVKPMASAISNDSTVPGATVKDALTYLLTMLSPAGSAYLTFKLASQSLTSVANIPATAANTFCQISANATMSLANAAALLPGYEQVIRVKNTSASSITLTLPSGAAYDNDYGQPTVSIPAGKVAEVNIWCYMPGRYSIRVGEAN